MSLCRFFPTATRPLSPFRFPAVVLALSTAVLTSGGCATGEGGSGIVPAGRQGQAIGEANERPLAEEALRELLQDVYVTPVQQDDVIVSHPPGEAFKADGIYVRIPNRTRQYGTFEIRGNEVCVQGADIPELCRKIVPLKNDGFFLIETTSGSAVSVTMTPLS